MKTKFVFSVHGMTCKHCENAVQEAVKKLSGVKKVKANKDKGTVLVEYDTSLTADAQIIDAITSAGYRVLL